MKAKPETIKEAIKAAERQRNMVATFASRYGINMDEYDNNMFKRVMRMRHILEGKA